MTAADRRLECLKILKAAERKGGITQAELAKRLGVDKRTIRRYFAKMKKVIQSATQTDGRIVYWIKENPLMLSDFTVDSAAAFSLGYHFLTPLKESFLEKEAKEKLDEMRGQLGEEAAECLDGLLGIFYQLSPGWCDYSDKTDIIETLVCVCEDGIEIEICYAQLEKDEEVFRIAPYAIIMQWGTLYLFGLDVAANVKRTWKVNRIREVVEQQKTFDKPTPTQINAWLKKSFGRFEDKPAQIIKIKATDYMAGYVKEHREHETQAIIDEGTDEAGRHYVIVQFEVVPTPALTDWILALGREGEVLEPKEYRDKVAEIIADMSKKYEKIDHEPQVT